MTATLATVRARVRTNLENASGWPDPLPVETSSETLTTLRDRVELHLQDSGNAIWASGDLDEAIEKALEEYIAYNPRLAIATVTLAADGREVDISGISNLLQVQKVWWPYDSTDPAYPPNWCQFDVYPGDILYINELTEPASGEKVRVWYTTPHTINGLNAAGATTIPLEDITFLINGAAWYAARQRAVEIMEDLAVDKSVPDNLMQWGEDQRKTFHYGMRQRPPAWQRYAYGFSIDDVDEAIRWAVGRLSEVSPLEAIGTITLASSGREIALTTLTGLLRVTRVWWPYDSSSPAYPPQWVRYEVWGSEGTAGTLFIDSGSEPQSGDVVRVWYDKMHTIEDLDSATTTTIPDDAETLIVNGAVGWVAEERILESPGRFVPRRYKEWAEARLREFERGLEAFGRRLASKHAGLHQIPALDRWDDGTDTTW